jgi:hypothetical protein
VAVPYPESEVAPAEPGRTSSKDRANIKTVAIATPKRSRRRLIPIVSYPFVLLGQAGLTTGYPSTQVTDYRSGICASRISLVATTVGDPKAQ